MVTNKVAIRKKKNELPSILVALQPLEDLIDDFVLKLINKTDNLWVIRLHPDQYGNANTIENYLKAVLIKENWSLSKGFVTLFDDIKSTNITVTKFSTVAWSH